MPQIEPEPVKLPTLKQIKTTLSVSESTDDMTFALNAVQEFLAIDGNEQYRDELAKIYQSRVAELAK